MLGPRRIFAVLPQEGVTLAPKRISFVPAVG